MAVYLFLIILLMLLILNKDGKNKIAEVLLFPTLFMICYCSKTIPDMDNYSSFYNDIGSGNLNSFLGYGWLWLCILGNKIGINYYIFKSILYVVACFFVYITIGKFVKKRRSLVFGIYLVFPGLLDLVQIRFFLASSILLYAVVCMITNFNKKTFLFYIMLLTIASLIHMSCLFYLVFLFLPLFKKFKLKGLFISFIFLAVLFLILSRFIDDILIFILPVSQQSRIRAYFNGDFISFPAIIVYGSLFILQFLLSFAIYKKTKKDSKYKSLLKYICLINVLLILSMPFVYVSSDFLRVQRPFLLLNYSLFIGMYKKIKLPKIKIGHIAIKYKELFYLTFLVYVILFIFIFNYQSLFSFLGF